MNKNNPVTCFYTVNASSSPCDAMASRREHLLFTDVKSSAQSDSTLGFVALMVFIALLVLAACGKSPVSPVGDGTIGLIRKEFKDPDSIDRAQVHALVVRRAVDFFDTNL